MALSAREFQLAQDFLHTFLATRNIEPAPTNHSAGQTGYYLRKGLGVWTVGLEGLETVIIDSRAMQLVTWLLLHPPAEPIHASVLENFVDGSPLAAGASAIDNDSASGIPPSALGGTIEEAAGNKLKGTFTLPELKQKLADLKKDANDTTLPQHEREQARAEYEELMAAYARGGRVSGQAEKSAERVRKALRTFINELLEANDAQGQPHAALRAFGQHLEQYLWRPSMGGKNRIGASGNPGCFTYEPPKDIHWQV